MKKWKDDEHTAAEFLDVFNLRAGYYLLPDPLPALEVGKGTERKIPGHRNPRESECGLFFVHFNLGNRGGGGGPVGTIIINRKSQIANL
jgi:hypothetical protein